MKSLIVAAVLCIGLCAPLSAREPLVAPVPHEFKLVAVETFTRCRAQVQPDQDRRLCRVTIDVVPAIEKGEEAVLNYTALAKWPSTLGFGNNICACGPSPRGMKVFHDKRGRVVRCDSGPISSVMIVFEGDLAVDGKPPEEAIKPAFIELNGKLLYDERPAKPTHKPLPKVNANSKTLLAGAPFAGGEAKGL